MAAETETALLWDIDGVVADSPHEDSWRKVAELPEWNVKGFTPDFYLRYVSGKPRYEGADRLLDMLGAYKAHGAGTEEKKKAMLEKFAAQKNNLIKELIEKGEFGVFESSVILILEAKKKNMKLGAASASKNANSMLSKIDAKKIAEKHKIEYDFPGGKTSVQDLFDVNVCGKTIEGGKPELFRLAAAGITEMTSGAVRKFVVFEDALSGVEAAKKNGFYCVGIARVGDKEDFTKAGADIVVHDLSETTLAAVLDGLFN